jgi:glucokinase
MTNYFIGIDLGGTRVKLGLIAGENIISRMVLPVDRVTGLAACLPLLEGAITHLIGSAGVEPSSLGGIGLAFPGLVDPVARRILSTNKKYDDAVNVHLPDWIKKTWNVPFFMENDARMAAVGEWQYGAAKDTKDVVMMTIGTGIGTAAIIDGQLLRGRHFMAGCLGGHIAVMYNGRHCTCGNIGCLEAYGSTWCLEQTARSAKEFAGSALAAVPKIDFATLFEAAENGDALAKRIKQDCQDVWSAGIVNLIHAYDPEVVVMGGGVMKRAAEILPYVTEKVHARAWTPWGKVSIRATQLHEDAGTLGVIYSLQHEYAIQLR